jgi:hypothetical protein
MAYSPSLLISQSTDLSASTALFNKLTPNEAERCPFRSVRLSQSAFRQPVCLPINCQKLSLLMHLRPPSPLPPGRAHYPTSTRCPGSRTEKARLPTCRAGCVSRIPDTAEIRQLRFLKVRLPGPTKPRYCTNAVAHSSRLLSFHQHLDTRHRQSQWASR